MSTVGADGSWPAEDGTLYGIPFGLNLKSLVWYPIPEFRQAGYHVPRTWDQLVALTNRMIADGRTPWCMGLESGGADGWPLTDWIENLLLRDAGPRVYDRWTTHQVAFDDQAVRRAFDRLGQIIFKDGAIFGGRDGAIVTPYQTAQVPMVDGDPPKCWLYHFPSFASSVLPSRAAGTTTEAFPFPSLNSGNRDVVIGGMSAAVVFADRPEVRAVVKFMTTPGFGREFYAAGTGAFSANDRFDMSSYDQPWRSQARLLRSALASDTFRFDGGDLMPPDIGSAPFWKAMIRYIRQGPASLNGILAKLDAAWPDDG